MSTMKLLLFIMWLISVGFAFVLGGIYFTDAKKTDTADMVTTMADDVHINRSKGTSTNLKQSKLAKLATVSRTEDCITQLGTTLSPTEMVNEFFDKQRGRKFNDMDLVNMLEFQLAVKQMNEAELIEALVQLDKSEQNPLAISALTSVVKQLASFSASNALNVVNTSIDNKQLKQIALIKVVSEWAVQDPESALDWHKTQAQFELTPEQKDSHNYLLSQIFGGLARQDLGIALAKMEGYTQNKYALDMITTGISEALESESDRTYFLEETKKYNNANIQDFVISDWFRDEPQQVLSWLSTQQNNTLKERSVTRLYHQWSYEQPQMAAEWYLATSDANNHEKVVRDIAGNWGSINPSDALNWVSRQTNVDSSLMLKTLFQSAQYVNPEFVIENLNRIPEEPLRIEVSLSLIRTLYQQNPEKAKAFAAQSDFRAALEKLIAKLENE